MRSVPAPVSPSSAGPRAGAPWPAVLPRPRAAAALVLLLFGLGVLSGAAAGPRTTTALAADAPIDLQLAALPAAPTPAALPTPTAEPAAAAAAEALAADEPAAEDRSPASGSVAAAPTPERTPEPTATPTPTATSAPDPEQPDAHHVFVIWLAGHGAAPTFAADSPATYLNATLRPQGALLDHYDGIAHGALANGIALLSGQGPNDDTVAGCPAPAAFEGKPPRASDGQAVGHGCLFGDDVPTLASRLAEGGRTVRAYQQDPCDAPVARNPLSYLGGECAPLAQLATDTLTAEDAPAVAFIAPGACDAGVTGACPAGGADGLARADAFIAATVPGILASAAYADGGVLLVVFDEGIATGPDADIEACCGQARGPNEPEPVDPQEPPAGGGRAGAVVVSGFTRPGTTVHTPFNHYALLRTLSRMFAVEPPGYAAGDGLRPFGPGVWSAR